MGGMMAGMNQMMSGSVKKHKPTPLSTDSFTLFVSARSIELRLLPFQWNILISGVDSSAKTTLQRVSENHGLWMIANAVGAPTPFCFWQCAQLVSGRWWLTRTDAGQTHLFSLLWFAVLPFIAA
jgi:hypothetical protein